MANALYGYYYDNPSDFGIDYYPSKDSRIIGPYDTFTDAKKALLQAVYKEREIFDVAVFEIKKLTKYDLDNTINEIEDAH